MVNVFFTIQSVNRFSGSIDQSKATLEYLKVCDLFCSVSHFEFKRSLRSKAVCFYVPFLNVKQIGVSKKDVTKRFNDVSGSILAMFSPPTKIATKLVQRLVFFLKSMLHLTKRRLL
ncbi:hypothetical protein Bca101_064847 [Brassica carinata]